MNMITSAVMLAITLLLYLHYRPKESVSRELCAVCGLMAVITPLAPGDTWFLQVVSVVTKAVALLCCYLQLRREICRRKNIRRKNTGRRPRGDNPAAEKPDLHLPAA